MGLAGQPVELNQRASSSIGALPKTINGEQRRQTTYIHFQPQHTPHVHACASTHTTHMQWKWSKDGSLVPVLHQCQFSSFANVRGEVIIGKKKRLVTSNRTLLTVHLAAICNCFKRKRKKKSYRLKISLMFLLLLKIFSNPDYIQVHLS